MKVVIRPDGEVIIVAHAGLDRERLRGLGRVYSVRRGGHVVPAARWKRWAFRLIRRTFAENSAVAYWTRRWRGPWLVDLAPSGGPVLGPFASRREAIAAEEAWLLRRITQEAQGERAQERRP